MVRDLLFLEVVWAVSVYEVVIVAARMDSGDSKKDASSRKMHGYSDWGSMWESVNVIVVEWRVVLSGDVRVEHNALARTGPQPVQALE